MNLREQTITYAPCRLHMTLPGQQAVAVLLEQDLLLQGNIDGAEN